MAAPEGNSNAIGNEGGRPPIHTDPKEVERLVEDYFQWIQGEYKEIPIIEKDEDGNEIDTGDTEIKEIRGKEPPTVTGLTLHLGFASKSTLYDYSKKIEFSHPIKKGLTAIEKFHEIRVTYGDKCIGNIFVLKNFGWRDNLDLLHGNNPDNPMQAIPLVLQDGRTYDDLKKDLTPE